MDNIIKKSKKDYLYHGSSERIYSKIDPMPSKIMDNQKVVFATQKKWLALVFAAPFEKDEIEFGYINDQPYINELKENSIQDRMNTSGFIYLVKRRVFSKSDKVGMKRHEFINNKQTTIIDTICVDNILDEFKKIVHRKDIKVNQYL
jgi:hypothetical protein